MVPHNAAHPSSHQPFAPFAHAQPSPLDTPAFDMLASPQVAKQMAALSAANQARIAQNARTGPAPPTGGTSSGAFLGGMGINNNNNHHASTGGGRLSLGAGSLGGAGQELEAHSVHANFETAPNNRGLAQTPHSATSPSFPDHPMSQNRNPQQQFVQGRPRQFAFLQQVAALHARRGQPLPPQLTGIPTPSFDPATTNWTMIEPSQEVGSFVLAGKDIDLWRLWSLVIRNNGAQALANANGWASILPSFDLPEEFHAPNGNVISLAQMLYQIYVAILGPFEEEYKRNVVEQQKKAQASAQRPGGMPGAQFAPPPNLGRPGHGMPNMQQPGMRPPMNVNGAMSQPIPPTNGLPYNPMHNQHRSSSSHQISTPDSHIPMDVIPHAVDSNLLDQDMQGIKRKHEQTEVDMKRARQKTEPPESHSASMLPDESVLARQNSQTLSTANGQIRPRQPPARRKIEYVPLKREVDSYGGRDLRVWDQEYNAVTSRRSMREVNEWGAIQLDWLCFSIRSRLSVELSYALTTFSLITLMRGGSSPNAGFALEHFPDILEDCLDLVEEVAFDGPEKASASHALDSPRPFTNRELVSHVQDTHGQPFASLQREQGSKDPKLGPKHRPADLVLMVVEIIHNLSVVENNLKYLGEHDRTMDILMRLCCVKQEDGKGPLPASKALSLADVLYIRKEVVAVIQGIASHFHYAANPTPTTRKTTRRMIDLLASYLVDPVESVPPIESIQYAGGNINPNRRPSTLVDNALEALTKFTTSDGNRPLISQVVPPATLSLLLERLVHRLPVLDADFQLTQRDLWMSYMEKIVSAIYNILFISSADLKEKIRADRGLAFEKVMMRFVHRLLQTGQSYAVRRAVEAIKLLDGSEETASSEQQAPGLSFGMGFDDGGDSRMERGTGLLGGHRDRVWEMLALRDVMGDEVTFMELDSLQRVDCS